PGAGRGPVVGARVEVKSRLPVRHDVFQEPAAFAERFPAQVTVAEGQEVERDEGGGRLAREPGNAGGGRMEPELERIEVQAATVGGEDHDLTVQDEPRLGQR